jgi:hypothetical protein
MTNNAEQLEELTEFNDYQYDYLESVQEAKRILEDSKITTENTVFEGSRWFLEDYVTDNNVCINFEKLNVSMTNIKFLNMSVIKCWVASLINSFSTRTVKTYYSGLISFFDLTDNLRKLNINEVLFTFEKYSIYTRLYICNSISNLIDYSNEIFGDKSKEVFSLIKGLSKTFVLQTGVRKLPKTKDILIFNNIFEDYFSKKLNEEEYYKWMPVYFWWKLTTIIPMRPTEFAKLERNCIRKEQSSYYLRINRIKANQNMDNQRYLSDIIIPKEIFIDMKNYINRVKKFGDSDTFISFPSIINIFNLDKKSIKRSKFTNLKFRRILNEFYNEIVFGQYNVGYKNSSDRVLSIEKLLLAGDTRHLAFINLKRQGYHPVEIARIGGHNSLRSQEHYFSHLNNLVDLEILSLMSNYNTELSVSTLDPSFVDKYIIKPNYGNHKLELEDGYCTDPEMNCRVEDCWECEHWRISADEFLTKKHLLDEKIANKRNELDEVLDSMGILYASIYNNLHGDNSITYKKSEQTILFQHAKKIDSIIASYIDLNKLREQGGLN